MGFYNKITPKEMYGEIVRLNQLEREVYELKEKLNHDLYNKSNISIALIFDPQSKRNYFMDYIEDGQLNKISTSLDSVTDFLACKNKVEYKQLLKTHLIQKVKYIPEEDEEDE